jgi:uncharacterized protein YjbK
MAPKAERKFRDFPDESVVMIDKSDYLAVTDYARELEEHNAMLVRALTNVQAVLEEIRKEQQDADEHPREDGEDSGPDEGLA